MRKASVLASLWIGLRSVTAAADDAPLQPVADPRPVLQDLQRKMSALALGLSGI